MLHLLFPVLLSKQNPPLPSPELQCLHYVQLLSFQASWQRNTRDLVSMNFTARHTRHTKVKWHHLETTSGCRTGCLRRVGRRCVNLKSFKDALGTQSLLVQHKQHQAIACTAVQSPACWWAWLLPTQPKSDLCSGELLWWWAPAKIQSTVLRRKQSPMHASTSGIWLIIELQGLTLPQAMYIFMNINSDIHLAHTHLPFLWLPVPV